jgi:hypothetical protein
MILKKKYVCGFSLGAFTCKGDKKVELVKFTAGNDRSQPGAEQRQGLGWAKQLLYELHLVTSYTYIYNYI